jgi:hypothetical protein
MNTTLTCSSFESAIRAALSAPAVSGSKWRLLEQLGASAGVRVSGAALSTQGNRRSRVRQILARRRHAGFGTFGMPGFGVLVLTGQEAELDAADAEHIDRCICAALYSELGATAERTKLSGVLIMRQGVERGEIVPRRLIHFASSPLSDYMRQWYAGIDVAPLARAAG